MQCPNCGTEHTGEFCNMCGQSNVDLHLPASELAREAVEEALGFDSRLRHTLKPFFLQPGELTRDYLAGRRVRYTSPLKLYLIASVLFFFLAARNPNTGIVHFESGEDTATEGLSTGLQQGFKDANPSRSPKKPKGRFFTFLDGKMDKFVHMGGAEASREMGAAVLNLLPKAMFVLVPLFAYLLKKFWSRRFYAEHLVFALHFHAFVMLTLIPSTFVSGKLDTWLSDVALAISGIYLFLALRRVYGESILRTFAKMLGLGLSYSLMLGFTMGVVGIVSLFTL